MKFWNLAVFKNGVSLPSVLIGHAKHLLLVLSLLCAALPVYSQVEEVIQVEEVTVEAVKHDEDVQDISISQISLNAETLANKSIEGLTDIANYIPGLNFESYSSGGLGTPIIRGLAQSDITSANQSVATYLDGIFIQRGYAIDVGVFDLEGLDVLKGPQSASFGRNAFAGVINYRLKQPNLKQNESSFTVTQGSQDREDYKVRISVPVITDVLAVSASYFTTEFGGTWKNDWIDGFDFGRGNNLLNSNKGDLDYVGGRDNKAFSFSVAAEPLEWLSVRANYLVSEKDEEFKANFNLTTSDLIVGTNSRIPGAIRHTTLDCGGENGAIFVCGKIRSDPRDYLNEAARDFIENGPEPGSIAEDSLNLLGFDLVPRPGRIVLDPSAGQFNKTDGTTLTLKLAFKLSHSWSAEYLYGNIDASSFTVGTNNVNDLFPSQSGVFNLINNGDDLSIGVDTRRNSIRSSIGSGPGGSNEITSNEIRFDFDNGGILRGAFGFYSSITNDRWAFENIQRVVNSGGSHTANPNRNGGGFTAQSDEDFFRSVGSATNLSSFLVNPGSTIGDGFLFISPNSLNVSNDPANLNCAVLRFGFCDGSARLIDSDTEDKVTSAFAKVELDLLGGDLNFILEGRYTEEDRESTFFQFRRGNSTFDNMDRFELRNVNRIFYEFAPRLITTYQMPFLPDSKVYFSAGRGVRSGGVNEGALIDEELTFESETNWTYELGSKNLFFDNKLLLNASLFYTDWRDYQNQVAATPEQPIDVTVAITENLGDVYSQGIEFAVGYQVTERLGFDIDGSYVETRFRAGTVSNRFRVGEVGESFLAGSSHRCSDTPLGNENGGAPAVCPASGSISGNFTPRQSPAQGRASVTWNDQILNGISLLASADVAYKSRAFLEEANLGWVGSRTLWNANLSFSKGGVKVQFWGKNLLDKIYVANSLVILAEQERYTPSLGPRRTFGVTSSINFY